MTRQKVTCKELWYVQYCILVLLCTAAIQKILGDVPSFISSFCLKVLFCVTVQQVMLMVNIPFKTQDKVIGVL